MRLRGLMAVSLLAGAALLIARQFEQDPGQGRAPHVQDARDAALEGHDAGSPEQVAQLDGAFLTVELSGEASASYMQGLELDDADLEFDERVRSLSREAEYDPWLGRAAREIAFQGAVLSESPPEAVLSFILRSSGAPEGSVSQLVLQTSGDNPRAIDDAIRGALKNAPDGDGPILVGIGEAATEEDEFERRVVVVVSRRDYDLETTPRSVEPGQIWHVRGRVPVGFGDAHASVLYPDNRIEELPVVLHGRHFDLEVYAGLEHGTVWLSIDGVGRQGPGKLLQLQVEVGEPIPQKVEVLLPPAESFDSVADAEAYALSLLNRDRESLGLPLLTLDEELSAIARGHSEDMRDQHFFGHLSPRTGLAGDRMARAGYRATAHGENLAFNDSVAEAESSLLESVGHRRNIVATNVDRVGIGLAREIGSDERVAWHLTQLFARRVEALNTELASQSMLDKMNVARANQGVPELIFDNELCDLARRAAQDALDMDIQGVPSLVAKQASALTKTSVAVSVHVFYELADLEPDENCLSPDFERVGMGFVRDQDNMHGRTILVQINAE